ncbi:hypothetical protein N7468_008606 [Penicillium chermesinum]|uniref:Secreted protein n=1 Tax=Penicillium chermesinum TaxID=63820 RepID=A0A9W9NSX2_9EURO|nr:uncharacterized protein N7468_008606 [Penicillium chermesinum]KAJ5224064.1 hypothetical protein N7468_008606 [Penicillium chermesinum]
MDDMLWGAVMGFLLAYWMCDVVAAGGGGLELEEGGCCVCGGLGECCIWGYEDYELGGAISGIYRMIPLWRQGV